jgi:hypothetical protein
MLTAILFLVLIASPAHAGTTPSHTVLAQESAGMTVVYILTAFVLFGLPAAGLWAVFVKADQPGWAAIVPIYGALVWLRIINRPGWWILLLCIPFVGAIFAIIMISDLAGKFGKSGGFGLGMLFLPFIFYPMLGFGDAEYEGRKRRRRRRHRDDEDEDDEEPRRRSRRRDDDEDERPRARRRRDD